MGSPRSRPPHLRGWPFFFFPLLSPLPLYKDFCRHPQGVLLPPSDEVLPCLKTPVSRPVLSRSRQYAPLGEASSPPVSRYMSSPLSSGQRTYLYRALNAAFRDPRPKLCAPSSRFAFSFFFFFFLVIYGPSPLL